MNLLIPVVEVGVHNTEIAEDVPLHLILNYASEDEEVRIVDHCFAFGSALARIKLARIVAGDGNEEARSHKSRRAIFG